jgi:SMC interacting uncharacterized protein involved in chromosome segregation
MIKEYLQALLTGMDEKSEALRKLQEKTDAQTALLKAESMDWDAFDALVDEKDVLIDELDRLDDGFNASFEKIKDELKAKQAEYRSEIAKLQEQIQEVTALSTTLQASEQRNHELTVQRFASERRGLRQQKTTQKAAANYYANMNKINLIDPQLMDKKK